MKAALITEFGAPLKVADVPEPQVGANDVLVKVNACGVCYSDVKLWTGRSPSKPSLPHILGHEIAGTVARIGQNATGLEEGDPVAVYLYDTCDQCAACRAGRDNHCIAMKPYPGSAGRPGGFAEYVSVPSKNALKVPSELDFSLAALLPDAFNTPYHAIVDVAQVRFNETAMLVGIGGLAMGGLQILKLIGAKVIAVSRTESKLEMAKKFGADITINSMTTDVVQEVKRLTDGHGVNHVFDFVTTPQTLDQGVRSTRPGGKVVFLGYSEPIPLNIGTIRFISLTSSRNGTRQNLWDLISLASEGKLKSQVTRTYSLDDATEALTALSKGEVTGRVVLRI